MKMLYIQASPRKAQSHSMAIGDAFIEAWCKYNQGAIVTKRNVFDPGMPEMDSNAVEARYLAMAGLSASNETQKSWQRVEAEARSFADHDHYVVASPMWNYNIPYKLKQYIDLIFQPGITVNPQADDSGMQNKRVCFILARGGMYSPGSPLDFQRPYLAHVFDRLGFKPENMRWLLIEPTADTSNNIKDLHTMKIAEALTLAKEF